MTSYQQQQQQPPPPSPAAPSGPSTSSTSTRNSKLDQIIQNFYTKTAQIVIQARCTPSHDARYGKPTHLRGSSTTKKMNKWFNIATEDVELLREDLKYWRTMAVQSAEDNKEPPPMILDIYLDTSKLSHNQSLVVADDNLRWGCVELRTAEAHHVDRILIESWELTLKHPFPEYAVDLPNLYKRSIVFFRSLHSLTRLLPSYDLYRKLHKSSDAANSLSIGYRLSTASGHRTSTEIALDTPIIESDARKPTKLYEFNDIVTPVGTFKLNVQYRRNCDFRIEDAERDLSAQFIDMDEQFFTPTMAKYQQQQGKQKQKQQETDDYFQPATAAKSTTATRPVSMFAQSTQRASLESKLENAMKQTDDDLRPSSLTSKHPTDISTTPRPFSSSSRNPHAESPTTGSVAGTPSSRRASAPFVVSPFKSPFLSSSPQAESIFSGAGSGGSTRHYSSTVSSDRSRPVDSGSFGRKIEFSSSFDKYKSSPTNRNTATGDSPSSTSMMRRWSRASDHSSIHIKSEHDDDGDDDDDDLAKFVKFVGSNQELRLFQDQRSNSATQMLSSASDSASSAAGSSMMMGASMSKKAALSHFQSLRDTHNSLSDSLTSSMLISNASASSAGGGGGGATAATATGVGSASISSQQHDPVTGISPVSSTSSTGRSYQPIIPSPLHAEQRSTSPVHIPRSFPQLRSLTNPHNALRLARLNPGEGPHPQQHEDGGDDNNDQEEDYQHDRRRRHPSKRGDSSASSSYGSGNNDLSAFSTYPQDHHHQHLNMLRNTAAATTGHTGGRAIGTPNPMPREPSSDHAQQQQQQQQQQHQQQRPEHSRSIVANDRYQLQRSQHNMDSSDNSLMQDNANASSGPSRANNSSLMDDDDSLVFKMSELECEGPPSLSPSFTKPMSSAPSPSSNSSKQHELFRYKTSSSGATAQHVFNNHSSSSSVATSPTNATNNRVNEHFLELTPTPLSPPLLHRLQNISMSTVTEEEERNSGLLSASGSSNKSDANNTPTSNPATSTITKPSHLPFNGW
ncbi:autophagy-related protein 13-domain-containing protein [Mucor lusitanicus]|uniref:Autophagy-related protein 13 n=1 Tax=Mucor lusitanicus CBS 277.49 TaxID=747725 RepID=A0A162U1A6_MUCCL|nr:hypothetical protein MUCCIDRAFT_105671 [Mucor lusitanicus CBS 277.49]